MSENKKTKFNALRGEIFSPARKMRSGFSLVEVLFTLMVLSVGTSAVAVLMTSDIKAAINAKNQVIAAELAQEGVELVKNLKDNTSNFTTDMPNGNDFKIEYGSSYAAFKVSAVNSELLKLSGGFFLHTAGTQTNFYRKIAISTDIDGNRTAESFVTWNGSGFAVMAVDWPSSCNVANKCVSVVSVLPDLD